MRTPSDAGAKKVAKAAATAGQRDVSFSSRLGFPALVALVCLLGIGAVVYARTQRGDLVKPIANLDHWHSVYGVYSCNNAPDVQPTDDGAREAKYLPPFQSTQDDAGIHSHGDGIMHIHPFFEISAGENAQLRHFLTEMNVGIDPSLLSISNAFDAPQQLVAGEQCADGSGTAEIKLLHWEWDFEALNEDRPEPNVIESDFGLVKFEHDREVFVFAYVSEDTPLADIPIPPQVRFDTLDGVSSQLEFNPTALSPQDSGTTVDPDADDASTDDAEASE